MPEDSGERGFARAQALLKVGAQAAQTQARVLRLQAQVNRLRGQRAELHQRIGQKVYALYLKDLVQNKDLRLLCEQARELEALEEEMEDQITALRGEPTPPPAQRPEPPPASPPEPAAAPDEGLSLPRDILTNSDLT